MARESTRETATQILAGESYRPSIHSKALSIPLGFGGARIPNPAVTSWADAAHRLGSGDARHRLRSERP
ncbi:hypothetical protein MKL09_27570 [Methylobacterium sp. J-048]|uniref:hypothetical protein n=1 Tax=Methylobacterium sp. J-048 TaxID=2836635 RepID=UPI001FB9330D|nr:hypothetical protein [Methylobacterium sp. J-048]MCJ2060272.1 hypothetical protein [Methylobacterium sp. J-048]